MKNRFRLVALGTLLTLVLIVIACARKPHFRFPIETMRMPPGGLSPQQVPMFVSLGTDDNPYSGLDGSGGGGGLHYLTELFSARRNPAGNGDIRNFDGQPVHYSFYVNTIYITSGALEDPNFVKQSWKEAIDHGHEIGVHTHSHPHGREFSVNQWQREIQQCIDLLTNSQGLRVPRNQLIGFRTPFLEYGDATLTAVQRTPFVYDCSIEEGMQEDQDGRNFLWPYKLDHGSPGNAATYKTLDLPLVREHPGLWELPVYAYIVPPDELCALYGVQPGFRDRMKQKNDYFDVDQGKITGMDWNLWYEYGMDRAEFVATLKHTLDLRLQGNRCPMMVGAHSAIYADRNPEQQPKTTVEQRRDALREFIDYALSKPEVRFVSAGELLGWLQAPASLSLQQSYDTYSTSNKLGAGFRYSVFNKKIDPDPEYWARVAKQMAARFPGATPEAIWIVSRVKGKGTVLSFPISEGEATHPLINSRNGKDPNEPALRLFDELNFRVWLQLEPGFAPVERLIHLVLQRYSRHRSVVGVGIDVEWYKSTDPDGGEPVTDRAALAWLSAARKYNPKYRLFLKHWLTEKMPPTVRDGLLFVDDSQIFPSMDPMIDEFAVWGKTFAPAPVAFQIGYPSDRKWWKPLQDPPKEIGMRILKVAPNTEGLFWVDYSALEVFPPDNR